MSDLWQLLFSSRKSSSSSPSFPPPPPPAPPFFSRDHCRIFSKGWSTRSMALFGSPLFFNPSSNPLIAWKESFFSREGTRLLLKSRLQQRQQQRTYVSSVRDTVQCVCLISSALYLSLRVGNENSMWKHFLSQKGKGKRVHSSLTKFLFLCLSKSSFFCFPNLLFSKYIQICFSFPHGQWVRANTHSVHSRDVRPQMREKKFFQTLYDLRSRQIYLLVAKSR